MRDMNQALLESPFDVEQRALADPFGMLLREIVTTSEGYGSVS
jgi:hypothetical protein